MNLRQGKKITLSVAFKDKGNNDAPVDGAPQWSVTDASLVSVTPSADGMTAVIRPLGPLGSCQVQLSADADLGAGVTSILGSIDVDTKAGDAVTVAISAGPEEDDI